MKKFNFNKHTPAPSTRQKSEKKKKKKNKEKKPPETNKIKFVLSALGDRKKKENDTLSLKTFLLLPFLYF